MKIIIERSGEVVTRDYSGNASTLLDELGINPVTVIVAADGTLVPLDTDISAATDIHILTIVSGG